MDDSTGNALERVQRVHAPADFEAFSTMCTRCFETQSSTGYTCTRRSKVLTHSLIIDLKTRQIEAGISPKLRVLVQNSQ